MADRPSIGGILRGKGLVSEADVAVALAHQAEHGGYFGEALVACGILSEEEVEWGLASQFDLPYVFPEADAVDYEAASLVAPEWALANLTIPILRTDEGLTVLVASPLGKEPIDELRAQTQLDVQLALASPSKIRALIREVYARGTAAEEENAGSPVELVQALEAARKAQAPRYGVSLRGARAWAWWDDGGVIRRRPLAGDWQRDLERRLHPGADRAARGESRAAWSALLDVGSEPLNVLVHFLADESGCEYSFQPTAGEGADSPPRFGPPPEGIVSEVRLLARSGRARFVVTAEPPELGHELLPHLPELLFDPGWRSIYVHADAQRGAAEVFSRQLPADPAEWPAELEALRAFHFDVVTVDLEGGADWADPALDVASAALVLWTREDVAPAYAAGIRWQLHVERDGEGIEWRLEPLESNSAHRSS